MLAIAATYKKMVKQFNIGSAYLNSDLIELIYICYNLLGFRL